MASRRLLILMDNHMDVVWRRGCRTHYEAVDGIIRPYSDLEEEQIRRAVDWCGQGEVRYTLEQALPLKLFLERNPDLLPAVQRVVDSGALELPGGGETLIDLNMVSGESLVRNHLYNVLWCQRTFGRRPTTAVGTDLFGYSAQVPQILRGVGYETLANTSRLMDDGVPFWRGLDGSTILIRPTWENLGLPQVMAGGGCTRPPTTCCDGDGCPLCGYRGMDLSDENVRSDDHLTRLFTRMQGIDGDEIVLRITGEETLENKAALDRLLQSAREHGFDPQWVTMTELVETLDGERLTRLRSGALRPEEIRPEVETAPICTGCYASRIRLKLWNRRLEALLAAAETTAALAWQPGEVYPRRKLERLWNDMALLQFHDALTGSHSDGAYDELLCLCRNIARGAQMVYDEAGAGLGARIAAPSREGYAAVAVLNPLGWAVEGTPLDIALDIPTRELPAGIELLDSHGQALPACDFQAVPRAVGGRAGVRLTGLRIPPHGYAALHYRFTDQPAVETAIAGQSIENEHCRLRTDAFGVCELFHKGLGQVVARGEVGGLIFEEDYGSVWETMAQPSFACSVARHSSPTVTLTRGPGYQRVVVEGSFADRRIQHERHLRRLVWRQEFTLYDGVRGVYLRTDIDWDSLHGRLMVGVPLAFSTPEDEAWYEVPFGVLPRRRYAGQYGVHTQPNGDWPALDFVAARWAEQDAWLTIANRGTPCHRVDRGTVKVTILRSPGMALGAWDAQGAAEVGRYSFDMLLGVAQGSLAQANPVRLAATFNAAHLAVPVTDTGALPVEHSLLPTANDAVAVSAVKRAEDGDDLVVRLYEPYGQAAPTGLAGAWQSTDLLEAPLDAAGDELRAHEIRTVRGSQS